MSGKGVLINVSFEMEKENERELYTTSAELVERRPASTFQLTPDKTWSNIGTRREKFTSSQKNRVQLTIVNGGRNLSITS